MKKLPDFDLSLALTDLVGAKFYSFLIITVQYFTGHNNTGFLKALGKFHRQVYNVVIRHMDMAYNYY